MVSKTSPLVWTAGLGLALLVVGGATLVWVQRPGLSAPLIALAGGMLGLALGGWSVVVILTYAPLHARAPLLRTMGLYWTGTWISVALLSVLVGSGNRLALLALVSAGLASIVTWTVWDYLRRATRG
jgi:hypothetical protein